MYASNVKPTDHRQKEASVLSIVAVVPVDENSVARDHEQAGEDKNRTASLKSSREPRKQERADRTNDVWRHGQKLNLNRCTARE